YRHHRMVVRRAPRPAPARTGEEHPRQPADDRNRRTLPAAAHGAPAALAPAQRADVPGAHRPGTRARPRRGRSRRRGERHGDDARFLRPASSTAHGFRRRVLTYTSPGSSGASLRPKYSRVPSADSEARVSEPGVLTWRLAIRTGLPHFARTLRRVAT